MDKFVNLKMLSHPINWLIVYVVIAIAAFAVREFHRGIVNCSCSGNDIPD